MIDFVVAVYYYKYYKWSQTTALTHTQTNKQWMREDWRKEYNSKTGKIYGQLFIPAPQNAFSSFLIINAVNRLREGGRTCTQTPPAHSSESIQTQRSMLDVVSPVRFASSVWIWVLICVILPFHMCFIICGILSQALGPWRRYPERPNLCHNNTTRTTTPSVVFAQLVRLCQSVSNSLFLPLYCYSLPLFGFFALTWFVGSFVLCVASKGTSPMYPVCSLGQW